MSKAWKKLDLHGAGLQSLNARLTHALKRRTWAYLLWLLFPAGAHRLYLESRAGSLAFVCLTTLTVVLWLALGPGPALAAALPEAALAGFDLFWIEKRRVALNKALRMKLYLGAGAAPPPDYRGRYPDQDYLERYVREKEAERAAHAPADAGGAAERDTGRVLSFREQERLLRELNRHCPRPRDRNRGEDAE